MLKLSYNSSSNICATSLGYFKNIHYFGWQNWATLLCLTIILNNFKSLSRAIFKKSLQVILFNTLTFAGVNELLKSLNLSKRLKLTLGKTVCDSLTNTFTPPLVVVWCKLYLIEASGGYGMMVVYLQKGQWSKPWKRPFPSRAQRRRCWVTDEQPRSRTCRAHAYNLKKCLIQQTTHWRKDFASILF